MSEDHAHLATFERMLSHDVELRKMSQRDMQIISLLTSYSVPLSVGQVADLVHLTYPTMSRLAQKLELQGLLKRIRSVTDQRLLLLIPTDAATKAAAQIKRLHANAMRKQRTAI